MEILVLKRSLRAMLSKTNIILNNYFIFVSKSKQFLPVLKQPPGGSGRTVFFPSFFLTVLFIVQKKES